MTILLLTVMEPEFTSSITQYSPLVSKLTAIEDFGVTTSGWNLIKISIKASSYDT